jgi:two-component system, cell cycle sensor histidine kinase and response regulator CckA
VGLHKKRYTGLHVARKIPARTNAKYRAIVEFAPEILALIASDGAIQFANPHLQNVLQHKTSEVEGRNIFEFIHPDDAARAAQEYSDTIQKEGEHIPTVLRLRTAKGEWVPFEIIASNRLNDPDVQAVVFTARDLRFRDQIIEDAIRFTNADVNRDTSERITELAKINAALRIENQARRQAECKLQHTVSLLNATLDSTADGILVVSLDGKVTSCNKHFMEMWKIDANCTVGKSDQDLLSFVTEQLRSPNEFLDKVQALYADPSATSFDVLYLKDGRIFERYSQPQRFDSKVVGRVWSFRDVTRARNLELELRQAQKMEALGRLAGGIAHDFNNLLMLISGYISQLMESASPSQRDICQQLMATTKRAAGVTKQLLAFSRKLPDQAKVADLNEIVIGMGAMLRRLLSDQTELQLSVSSNPQPVKVDASRIELIIMNLAINAQDAMPKGGSLSIATTEVTKSEGKGEKTKKYSVLQMSDAGTGMSTEVRKHIFEPFFTTKGIGKGTGLGLSTVLGIVHESGGHIEVDSEPNRGTTFLVYLPQSEESLATSAPAAIDAPERGEETILLAEDEAGIRALTKAYLEGLGYLVLAAADGKEAIKISQEYDGVIHLVLTDLLMPGTRGDFAVEEIRKTRPNIQVILMSGYVDTEPLFSAEAMLHKPFEFPELGRRLREVLDQRTESISNLRRIDDGAGA